MDEIVARAIAKWPNVPAVYGWLSLDRRGNWAIKGERIRNRLVAEFIARNYGHDAQGRWFFQNGPQRVFVQLAYTPLVYRTRPGDALARVRLSARRLADLPAFDRDFRHRFDAAASAARLPDEVRRAIGDSHVDLIGYSQGLLHLNGFEHRTRPVIQSYSAYTPFLAERNRAFLATDRAPAFLVASLETVDGRYPAQDDAPLLARL